MCVLSCSVMSDFLQMVGNGLPFPPPGNLPNPGIKPTSPLSPSLQVDSLLAEPSGKPTDTSTYIKNPFRHCYDFLAVIYSPWSSQHLLAPWSLLPNALGSTLGLWFPSSATHFLWLLLCLEPSEWRTEKGKKGMETRSLSSHHCSSGQAKWFFSLPQDFRCLPITTAAPLPSPPPPRPHCCPWGRRKRRKEETNTRGFPRSLSLPLRGTLISWIRNKKFHLELFLSAPGTHFWVSGCLWVQAGQHWRKKKWQTHCWLSGTLNSGLLPQSAGYNLCFRALRELLHPFCPGFIVALSVQLLCPSYSIFSGISISFCFLNHWCFVWWKKKILRSCILKFHRPAIALYFGLKELGSPRTTFWIYSSERQILRGTNSLQDWTADLLGLHDTSSCFSCLHSPLSH